MRRSSGNSLNDVLRLVFAEEVTKADVVITELGVHRMLSQPLLYSASLKERGASNAAIIIHVSLVPYIAALMRSRLVLHSTP